jgi:PAS domain S-box-containing protein
VTHGRQGTALSETLEADRNAPILLMTHHNSRSEPIAVLCVDDDPEFVTMLKRFLEREHDRLEVTTATSATVGLNHLSEDSIDCVVSDYDMPRTDGLEFLRMVRAQYPELPFILFTGKGDEMVAGDAVSAGATDYLQKKTGIEQYEVLADRITAAVARQQAEMTLRRAAEEQSTVIESINDAVYRVDSQGQFVSVNEALAEMSGYDRDELLGVHASVLKDDATIEQFEDAIRAMLRGEIDDATISFEMQTADGGQVRCEDNLSLLPLDDGEYTGVVGTIRDMSTRTRRTERLERENERLDEFASMVSHDLRSPLSIARGRISLAREEHESDHLDDAQLALQRMDTLIDDLLTLARQEVSPSDLGDVSVREVTVTAEQMIDEGVDLTFDADLGEIEADETRLQEIFENLLINAVQHVGPDVTVHIGPLSSEEGFYIADDGPGIPAEEREQVFEPCVLG